GRRRRILRDVLLSALAEYRYRGHITLTPVATEQKKRRRPVSRQIAARRVDHLLHVEAGQHLFDERLAVVAFRPGIAIDHADEASFDTEVEEAFGERR